MLDIKFIRENKVVVKNAIENKKVSKPIDLDELIRLYDEKKSIRQKIELLQQKKNEASESRSIEAGAKIKKEIAELEKEFESVEKKYIALMLLIPNIPSPDTPIGLDESANKIIRQVGDRPTFTFTPKEHFEIGERLGLIDTETAAKVSGTRFTYLKGDLVLMHFAVINLCFEILTNKEKLELIAKEANLNIDVAPFIPVLPPVFVKTAVQNRMARLMAPEEHYIFKEDDVLLVGSAEHALGPMHMDQVFEERELPIRYVGYSSAFRREAGSYGKDTKGILRLHQFDKLEMEVFSLPENSMHEQNFMVAIQEQIMKLLQLPYQVVAVCSGDMGFPDYRQIDIETWMPGQNKYRETHSADLMAGFQARRLNTRVKRADGKIEHVHMNDATVMAQRPLIAIIENYQTADGAVRIPDVLQKYMGGKKVIEKN